MIAPLDPQPREHTVDRGREAPGVVEVADAESDARRLVAVGVADPAAGGADRTGARFRHRLDHAVIGQDEVGGRAHAEHGHC